MKQQCRSHGRLVGRAAAVALSFLPVGSAHASTKPTTWTTACVAYRQSFGNRWGRVWSSTLLRSGSFTVREAAQADGSHRIEVDVPPASGRAAKTVALPSFAHVDVDPTGTRLLAWGAELDPSGPHDCWPHSGYAIMALDGTRLAEGQLAPRVSPTDALLLRDDAVLVYADGPIVRAVDTASGREIWTHALPPPAGAVLLARRDDESLLAVTVTMGEPSQAILLTADGTDIGHVALPGRVGLGRVPVIDDGSTVLIRLQQSSRAFYATFDTRAMKIQSRIAEEAR